MELAKGHIVVIDDDQEMRRLVSEYFESQGYRVTQFELAKKALTELKDESLELDPKNIDLVISDIKMPQMTGTEFAQQLKQYYPDIPVILITAFGSIESAIEAMRLGAYDYIVKPFKLSELKVTAERALEYRRLHVENAILRQEIKKPWNFESMLGKSPSMQSIFELIKRVSKATASILITGESGTGKEMVARAVHQQSDRCSKPFVAINCTAIPENLLESELFGHAKGAFTGAVAKKIGLFEEAHGGTIFLDEIGDLDPALQAKLLRVLQERKIRPVGDNTLKEVDVRVVAATHKDLKLAIKEGRFREDLYYRLSVIPIHIPPLRERKEDIPLLAEYFLKKYSATNQSSVRQFSSAALGKLMEHRWFGNVRELQNLIERSVVLSNGTRIEASDIPDPETPSFSEFFDSSASKLPSMEELEKQYIQLVLQKTLNRKDKAAEILGINRRTLYRKEREFGLENELSQ